MKLAWATDIHLNFIDEGLAKMWCHEIRDWNPDAVLISGDIAEATDVEDWLRLMRREIERPVHFVLGNHDYYHGSLAGVRDRMRALGEDPAQAQWLGASGVVQLTEHTALIGHDCWNDARYGDYANSTILLNDYRLIEDLAGLDPEPRGKKLNDMGDDAAAYVGPVLEEALARYTHVVFVCHYPPFRESCWYKNRVTIDEWLPHLACKAVGDVLLDQMAKNPERMLTVLCGHTHHHAEYWPLHNLCVRTGPAEYGAPAARAIIVR